VETDVNKLVNYVCGTNIYKEGEDVKIKPDSEYPSWLWTIRTGPPPSLEEMDPNTKQYWRKMRLLGLKKKNKERMMRKF
jgi:large subunit ribosomal protein L54